MRQTHVADEQVFVDFAGDTINIADIETGEVRAVKLFVATSTAFNSPEKACGRKPPKQHSLTKPQLPEQM